jgi:hypothetical protein
MKPRSTLYQMEAFGLRNEWVVWKMQRSGLDGWCVRCKGRGITIASPCPYRDSGKCTREDGCAYCRRRCPLCKGARVEASDVVRTEDFGDRESLDRAIAMFPGLHVVYGEKRSDMAARAL